MQNSRVFIGVVLIGLSMLFCDPLSAKIQAQESPRLPGSNRVIAEWEQAVGTLVAWPLAIPDELVIDLSKDAKLFVLVNSDKLEAAKEKINSLKVSPDQVQFISCSVESNWPRDWGPHQIFRGDGEMSMVNHRFDGYPVYPQTGEEAAFTFRTGPGDDAVCTEVAQALGHSSTEFPAYLTGGNFLVDGHGTAFCTQAQLTENRPVADEVTYRQLVAQYLGINRLVVLENTEPLGIQHIDCWMKVLDSERLWTPRSRWTRAQCQNTIITEKCIR